MYLRTGAGRGVEVDAHGSIMEEWEDVRVDQLEVGDLMPPGRVARLDDAGDGARRITIEARGSWLRYGHQQVSRRINDRRYPRVTEDGRTVWACCESSIDPQCQHRATPPARHPKPITEERS